MTANRYRFVVMACLLLAFGITIGQDAMASSWSVLGFDQDSIALGGAQIGGVAGPASVYYNPAGLAKTKSGEKLASHVFGFSLLTFDQDTNADVLTLSSSAFPTLTTTAAGCSTQQCIDDVEFYNTYVDAARATNEDLNALYDELADAAASPRNINGLTLGIAEPLATIWDRNLVLGLAIFVPLEAIVYQRIKDPLVPYFLRFDDSSHVLTTNLALGIEITDWLRLGIGVDMFADVAANAGVQIILPPALETGGLPPDPNLQDIVVSSSGTVEFLTSFAPTAGLQANPVDWLEAGISFRDQQNSDVSVDANVHLNGTFGRQTIPITLRTSQVFTPREIGAGAKFSPTENIDIHVDAKWQQWSSYTPPFAFDMRIEGVATAGCNVVGTIRDLDDLINAITAATGGEFTSDAICDFLEKTDLDEIDLDTYVNEIAFNDTINPGIGVEVRGDKWAASGGYRYAPTPVPTEVLAYNILDTDIHTFSGGFSYWISENVRLGLTAQVQWLATREVTKSRQDVLTATNAQDGFPDVELDTDQNQLNDLEDITEGFQVVAPGYPGYSIGGAYVSTALSVAWSF